MSSRSDRANKLKQLREAKLTKSKAKKIQDDEQFFEELEEDTYKQLDEDFVEDDDNAGYIDNGFDDQVFSDEEYDQEPANGKRKRKTGKQEKNLKKEPVVAKPNQQINRFFNNSTLKSALKPKPKPVDEEETEDFMASLLSDFSSSSNTMPPAKKVSKSLKSSPLRSAVNRPKTLNTAASMTSTTPVVTFNQRVDAKDAQKTSLPSNENGHSSSSTVDQISNNILNDTLDEDIMFDNDFGPDDDMDAIMDDADKYADTTQKEKEVDSLMVQQRAPNFKTTNLKQIPSDLQGWKVTDAAMADTFNQDTMKEETQKMDILESNKHLHFWWYDAYERKEKGYVYLFGKVLNKGTNKYVSCCVTVKNIERNLFILPRARKLNDEGNATEEEVSMADVYSEISELCTKKGISKFASKEVKRKYAFESPDVPTESSYLKVLYGYDQPAFTGDETGKCFSKVFGAPTGPLEHFLIKRDIMGPCWLDIADAQLNNVSETWCKVEICVEDPKTVNPLVDASGNRPTHFPPLVVMSLCLRTILNEKKNVNEIVAASAFVCDSVQIDNAVPIEQLSKSRFTVVRQLDNKPYPANFTELAAKERKENGFTIQVERKENSLLNYLIARIYMCDPDVIVGHNFAGFDLDVLLHRMKALNIQNWHRLGRLKRRNWPKLQAGAGGAGESTFQERLIMSGRLVCDTYLASKDLIRSKSYRMTDLAQSQLKIHREDIEFGKSADYFDHSDTLLHLLKHCSFDSFLAMALMFKLQILPLTHQLTNLAGNMWSRTMTGARAERNEYLLLHEFHKAKYICPEKTYGGSKTAVVQAAEMEDDEEAAALASNSNNKRKTGGGRRKPAYSGGLVLEPKKGFYDKYVLLLDFNSLYPSIIQEYNICFTTVNRASFTEGTGESGEEKVPDLPDETLPQGILPRLIKTLVDRRRQVKDLMKGNISEAEYTQLDIRQKALKLTANSMYGCLGFTHSRFYAKPLAMLITHKGREILQSTVNLAGSLDMNVIYGDTDSIMVYTNQNDLNEVKKMGTILRKAVNKRYKLLEIGIDGYFKHMLLLKKKKYAALLVEEKPNGELVETVETKGLDLVRRDWCDLSHDVSERVLNFILSDHDREEVVTEIHEYLEVVAEQIRQGDVPLEKYVINKQLTKRPQDYTDAKNQPHVQVALRLIAAGHNVKSGDTIPYVICKTDEETSGDKRGSALRAYHPDDVIKNNMQLDIEWYLHQQVHPPLTRLCSPIEGTDPARLAECLGLDTRKYNFAHTSTIAEEEDPEFATLDSQISDEERFQHCARLHLRCQYCGEQEQNVFESIIRVSNDSQIESGFDCTKCHITLGQSSIRVQVITAIRKHIQRYYEGWYVCDDVTCNNRTRMLSVFGRRCILDNCRGTMKREYTDKQLYTQLLYFSSIFDPSKAKDKYLSGPFAGRIMKFLEHDKNG
ncbi:DNA polymerase family B-domain-containing protein [Mycotypha africana]|uniref:DNA polymerase family B-domain-containing protein n=1 Tax=Mycotypha africana TaxID=64632 RepID=UPI0023004116|nr:DNA polymerase family B-domain-containing protein [Mycotypha africana]KAI8977403.1 DNA polymerase family B-domain-containing protein [Mycotypha africana]